MGSIRTRLTIFYSLAAFLLLAIVAIFLYWETINILYKTDYQFLSDEVDTIQEIINSKDSNLTALKKIVTEIPRNTDNSIYRYYIRILDEKNKIISQTAAFESVFPNRNEFSQQSYHKKYLHFSRNGKNYLLVKSPLVLLHQRIGSIQIILDVSHQHAFISDKKLIIFLTLIIVFFALLIGLFVSYKGMQSLYSFIEATKKISAASLSERIHPQFWPQELYDLAVSFNQMMDRVEASFMRLKQFSADLAHELRTPLSNIIGQTEIAFSYTQSVEEYRNILGSNLEELQRIAQLIENILFLARTENPELIIEKKLLNVRDEIVMVCEFYQACADEKNIQISYEGQGSLRAHSVMFRRMISNILSNSLKFTQKNGSIQLRIEELAAHIKIIMTDDGIGIDKKHLPKIFNRFYRVDAARTHYVGEREGVGLGLSIVKSIVELHQGSITIESELGQGTTLILTFPK